MSAFDWTRPTGFLTIDGVRLEYACHGPAPDTAPTLVMLHEGLGSVALWRDIPRRLAEATGFGVFVYSRQGYGQSDPAPLPRPLDFMTIEATRVLPAVLDAIGLQRGVLLGHSDGATIAAIHSGSVIDHRVRGQILIAPHFFTETMGLQQIARARTDFETTDLRDRMGKYHADPDAVFRGWSDVWLDPEFEPWNVAEVIDYFRTPTLAIQGVNDQYGTLAQIREIEDRSYAPVDVVTPENCGHSPHLEQGDLVIGEIACFLRRLERIEAAGPVPA